MEKTNDTTPSASGPTESPLAAPRPVPTVTTDRLPVPNASVDKAGPASLTPGTLAAALSATAASNARPQFGTRPSLTLGAQESTPPRSTSFSGIARSNAVPAAGIESKTQMPQAALPIVSMPSALPVVPMGNVAATEASADTGSGLKSAQTPMTKSPLRRLAAHDDRRAAIVHDFRKADTRGAILAGRRYIKAAERDRAKAADLRAMYDGASDRDKGAIEVACRNVPGFSGKEA